MKIKNYIMEYIKHHAMVNNMFYTIGSAMVSTMNLLVKPDDHLILFNSFGGKKYDDSPKAIYEFMKNDSRFAEYRLVWAFHEPEKYPEIIDKIKTDDFNYFLTALKARVWITNSSIQRGLHFCGKHTYRFNSWHGTPMKQMGRDKKNTENAPRYRANSDDVMLAQRKYEIEKMSEARQIPRERIKKFGLPRNDELLGVTKEQVCAIRNMLGIPDGKKVILYAPTFREYMLDDLSQCTLSVPIDFKNWHEILGDQFIVLFRAHYEVAKHTELPKDGNWLDVSTYPHLNELMMAADILVSDYSSIFFDYSITEKPMFHFAYDYDEYNRKRGLYFDIRKELSGACVSNELARLIATMDFENEVAKCRAFRDKYVEAYGTATQQSVEWIAKQLNL